VGRVRWPSILVVLGGVRVPEGAQALAGTAGFDVEQVRPRGTSVQRLALRLIMVG
jgi:hypothetical protein